MRVCMMLARLLHATHEPDAAECLEGVLREVCSQHRELFSEEKLRSELDIIFEDNNILEGREMMAVEEIYLQVKDEKPGGYFAIAGMLLTDEMWHRRYVGLFAESKVDAARDEEMVRRLMHEMATERIWKEANRELGKIAFRALEKNYNGNRGQGAKESGAVHVIGAEIGNWLPPGDRRWRTALELLLAKNDVAMGIAEGKYDGELVRMMDRDEELEHVFCGWMLRRQDVLDRNEMLARKVIVSAIKQGYWLYGDELKKAMGTEKTKKLSIPDDVFGRIRVKNGAEGKSLIRKLKELVRKGRLEKLVRRAIERLVRHGEINDLKRLMKTVEGRRLFDGLVRTGELETELKEGMKRLTRDARIDELKWLIKAVEGRRLFDRLVRAGELSKVLQEGIDELIRHGWTDELKWLAETVEVRGVFDALVASGELDMALKEGIEELIKDGRTGELKWLIETAQGRFGVLVGRGELDAALKKRIEVLIRYGWIHALRRFVETLEGRFGILVLRGELDAALEEGTEGLIRDGRVDDLRRLIEMVEGRLDVLVLRGELDAILKEGMEGLTRNGRIDDLRNLMKIEVVKERAFGGLFCGKELDLLKELAET